jgi:hypothetical protein
MGGLRHLPEGRNPFAEKHNGFDTLGFGEVLSHLAQAGGLVRKAL